MPPPPLQLPLDPTLATVIEGTTLPLLYVGFGSMEKFMLDVNWEDVFETLESGVHALVYPSLVSFTGFATELLRYQSYGYDKSAGRLE